MSRTLKFRRCLVAAEAALAAVVKIVVAGRRGNQRGEFPLFLLEGIADVDEIDAVNAQVADDIDLMLTDHFRNLQRVVAERLGIKSGRIGL